MAKKLQVKTPKPSRQIRVSEEVFDSLADKARPLRDTPDAILRRMLKLPERPRQTIK